jgi:hypothetical protein
VLDIPASYMNNEVSSDEEMADKKFAGATYIGASDFHSRLLADTASRRKLKAREAFTVPFCFLCDHADQSYQSMSFIAMRLEILKMTLRCFMKKTNKCQSIQRVKICQVWVPVVFHWKKPELGQGEKPTKMDDVV